MGELLTSNDCFNHNLVGGFNPSEKYEFVSWDHSSQDVENKSSKSPTSNGEHDDLINCFTIKSEENLYFQTHRNPQLVFEQFL